MDVKSTRRRGNRDQENADIYVKEIMKMFPVSFEQGMLNYFFLDAKYDLEDGKESEAFEMDVGKLWMFLTSKPPLSTDEVSKIKTQNEILTGKIAETEEIAKQNEEKWKLAKAAAEEEAKKAEAAEKDRIAEKERADRAEEEKRRYERKTIFGITKPKYW